MSKEIKRELEKIEVPAELHERVKLGVAKAKQEALEDARPTKTTRQLSNKRNKKIAGIAAASILAITLSSGFIHPAMNQALASTPLLGGIYEKFGDKIGMHLAEQNLVTELDQAITQNGVTVKLTNVYFDGDVVSITGNVSGDLEKGHNEPGEVSFDVNFENNKGDNDPWLNGKSTSLQEAATGYDFQWKLNYPYKDMSEEFTLPISIHNINGIKGEWNFNVPITQQQGKALVINQSQAYDNDGVKITIKELKQANVTSTLTFETISTYEGDHIDLGKAVDENGTVLFKNANNTRLSSGKVNEGYQQVLRKSIDKIAEGTKAITFYPTVSIADPTVQQQLNTSSFTLESERTDLAIKVNNVKQDGNKLILDYQFQGLVKDMSNHQFDVIRHNLSYAFTLVDKDFVDKIDPENPVPPEGHSISRNEVKVIDKNNHQFQAVFDLKGEERYKNFSLEDAVLKMDFYSFIGTKELAPFTVELPQG